MRDFPDVAIIASPYSPGVFWGNTDSYGSPVISCCIGGTSLSAPVWAGIAKLLAQLSAGRTGSLNPRIYALANTAAAASGFRDVTVGNNNFNGVAGFSAGPGFDQTSGWGSVDISTFGNSWVSPPATPAISSIPSVIQVGSSFNISGNSFSPGAKVNFFVATSSGPVNAGPLTPSSYSPTLLTVPVPATVPLGNGFVSVQVVNADLGYRASNVASALLQGSAAAGIPTITSINGVGLAPTSSNPAYATNNVQTVLTQGSSVTLGGSGFDTTNGVAVLVYCACTGGRMPTILIGPGGFTSSSLTFTLPSTTPTGPLSLVVVNSGPGGGYSKSSNAVSVVAGATISITSVTQSGSTITVKGTGFSTLTVINLFNTQGGSVVNLGGFAAGGVPKIPLTVSSSTMFTFSRPAAAMSGASYVQAFNPPFVPYTSSGSGPGGAFTLFCLPECEHAGTRSMAAPRISLHYAVQTAGRVHARLAVFARYVVINGQRIADVGRSMIVLQVHRHREPERSRLNSHLTLVHDRAEDQPGNMIKLLAAVIVFQVGLVPGLGVDVKDAVGVAVSAPQSLGRP